MMIVLHRIIGSVVLVGSAWMAIAIVVADRKQHMPFDPMLLLPIAYCILAGYAGYKLISHR